MSLGNLAPRSSPKPFSTLPGQSEQQASHGRSRVSRVNGRVLLGQGSIRVELCDNIDTPIILIVDIAL